MDIKLMFSNVIYLLRKLFVILSCLNRGIISFKYYKKRIKKGLMKRITKYV